MTVGFVGIKLFGTRQEHMPDSAKDRFTPSYEFVYFFSKNEKYYFDLDSIRVPPKRPAESHKLGKNPGDVWLLTPGYCREAHFAVFPDAIPERIINCSTRIGDTVLDPFMGSGTTALVAERLAENG